MSVVALDPAACFVVYIVKCRINIGHCALSVHILYYTDNNVDIQLD